MKKPEEVMEILEAYDLTGVERRLNSAWAEGAALLVAGMRLAGFARF